MEIKQPSILHRFVSSIPIIGAPLAILIEHAEIGIAQHGTFLGVLRGALVGLVIALTLFVLSEAVTVTHNLLKVWLQIHVEAPGGERLRTEHVNETARVVANQVVHRGMAVGANRNVSFYVAQEVSPWVIDGNLDLTDAYVMEHDPAVFERRSMELDSRMKVRPFFRRSSEHRSSLPFASESCHSDVATVIDPQTKAEYAMAALDEDFILIPIAEYKAAALPMSEESRSTRNTTARRGASQRAEKDQPTARTAMSLDIAHAITISEQVPFVGIDCTDADSPLRADLSSMLADAAQMTRWFHQKGTNQPRQLPAGTYYRPYVRSVGDPNSILTVDGQIGLDRFLVVTARIKDRMHPDGDDHCGLIPKAEYDAYVRGMETIGK